MTLHIASDIWRELKRYVSSVDRSEAADTVVNVLIDNDFDAEEVRQAFKGDNDIKQALATYLTDEEENFDEDDEDDYDDEY